MEGRTWTLTLAICVALGVCWSPAAEAKEPASPAIEKIRAQYQKATQNGGQELYQTVLEVNPGRLPAPGVGVFFKRARFFFAWPGGSAGNLIRAEIDAEIAAPQYHEEYLFEDLGEEGGQGALIFAHVQGGPEEREERYYFDKKTLVRVVQGKKTIDKPAASQGEQARDVQRRAERVLAAFRALQTMPP
ncbi:MAG: hypothetical protein GYA21_14110 [Myxococcales bacterium]|nr:hypothetical protein [Myxococcales bacterium]